VEVEDGGEMLIQDLAAVTSRVVQMKRYVVQAEHYVFYFDVHAEAVERVRTLENRLHPERFPGHWAFTRQAPNDIFGHDGAQQIAVTIAECVNEIEKPSLTS
jgi:hypothetical protein